MRRRFFSGNFHEAKALEDDLVRLEGARRNASERLARLEASENARLPTLKLIEAASVPQQPWRPDYLRDALYNLLASFALGLLALWFVELFNRSASPASTTVVVPQPWITPSLSMETALPAPGRALELEHHAGPQGIPQLPSRASLPRELSQNEVAALMAGTDGDGRVLCALLLVGLTVDELKTLACTDIDPDTLQLKVRGPSARTLTLPDWLAQPLAKCRDGNPERPLLTNSLDQPLSESDIRTRIACAALDAGIESAATLSPEVLRHTYIAYLMHQNVRFSDLSLLAGQLGADELAAYAETSSGLQRVRGEQIDPLMPALRQAPLG